MQRLPQHLSAQIHPNGAIYGKVVSLMHFYSSHITLGEIALGICFILGLFTVLAALGSIFMNLNFIISGSGDMWFLVVSIAMLAGAGRSFGLDYYVIPYASKVLKRLIRRSQMNLT